LGVLLAHLLFSLFPFLGNYTVPDSHHPQVFWWEIYAALPPVMVFINGTFSVSIFFVLSGCVLTKKFFDTGDKRVLAGGAIKRYPRLIIPAALSVLFAWALLSAGAMNTHLIPVLGGAGWPYDHHREPASFLQALRAGFNGAPFFTDVALNSPLWTIRIELLGSLFLFAAYAVAGPRLALALVCFLALSFAANWGSKAVVIHFFAIFAGSLLNRFSVGPKLSVGFIVVGLICGGFDYSPFYAWVPRMWGMERNFAYTLGAFLIVAGTLSNFTFARMLETRIPMLLGKLS